MRSISAGLAIAGLLVLSAPAAAITFADAEKPDPFAKGETCPVRELMSYGGYIYQYPSKYDLVFEPLPRVKPPAHIRCAVRKARSTTSIRIADTLQATKGRSLRSCYRYV